MNALRLTGLTVMAGLLTMAVGCSSSDCYENHSAMPLADFFSTETFSQVNVNRLEIYGLGAPNDSVLYFDETLSQAYLPFRIWSDTTTYIFAYLAFLPDGDDVQQDQTLVPHDTLTFIYKRQPWFVSPGCGAMYYFDMDTVVHTSVLVDSVYVNPIITNENSSNIKIFFKSGING